MALTWSITAHTQDAFAKMLRFVHGRICLRYVCICCICCVFVCLRAQTFVSLSALGFARFAAAFACFSILFGRKETLNPQQVYELHPTPTLTNRDSLASGAFCVVTFFFSARLLCLCLLFVCVALQELMCWRSIRAK